MCFRLVEQLLAGGVSCLKFSYSSFPFVSFFCLISWFHIGELERSMCLNPEVSNKELSMCLNPEVSNKELSKCLENYLGITRFCIKYVQTLNYYVPDSGTPWDAKFSTF